MEKKEKAPVLRFKDTNGKDYPAWEQRKLGDIGTVQMNKRIFKTQTSTSGEIPFYKIGTFGKIPDAYISRELFEEYKKKYPYPKKGDLLLSASGSIGNVVEYNGEEAYFQDSNIVWLEHGKTISNFFLKAFYSVVNWEGIEGTTIKRLYNKTILDTPITLPSFEEQEKFGNFFTVLDKVITLHQRKLEALKKLKRTLLQKMFPKKGHLKPELRFFGFTNDWEQRKLEELASKFTGGGTPNTSNPNYWNGEIPWIQSSDLKEDDVLSLTVKKHISQEGLENSAAKIVPKNSLVIVTRVGVGKLVVNNQEIATSQDFLSLSGIKGDSRFLAYSLYSLLKKNSRRVQGTSIKGITKVDFLKETILIPSLEEQEKISSCMVEIDKLITLHQRKLEIYKKLKKGLLQKMFI